ncbi:MAG: pyridoxamine 5'-phosphate oxidase family protein [Sphingobium sp.]
MTDRIDTLQALAAVIGKTPAAIHLKVIDHLDETALRWIAASPLAFITIAEQADIGVTLAGGEAGFASGDAGALRLPLALLDDPGLVRAGAVFGSLFLAPGIGETLRVNGRVVEVNRDDALIAVDECYVHCAKALIRSHFWQAEPLAGIPDDPAAFIAASRFMALGTSDGEGHADLSPKGDPAGLMAMRDATGLWFADRPGNRRVDSFRNILVQPNVAAALLVPGSHHIAIARGRAHLTCGEAERARFAVQGKMPLLAVGVEDPAIELRPSAALRRANLWPLRETAQGIVPAKMFAAHVKLNKDKGLGARLAGAVMSIPGLMQKGLDKDYKDNLY